MDAQTTEPRTMLRELLARALRIIPAAVPIDWSSTHAAMWHAHPIRGTLRPVPAQHVVTLDDLLQIDDQKEALVANTEAFCRGHPANHALLWGARGTGKSSLIHALLNRFASDRLRMIEVDKESLADVAQLANDLRDDPYRFIVVCDDLSFDENDGSYRELKSALEGSVFSTASNVLIYVTSNRRHLMLEHMRENLAATHEGGELHHSETVEEKVSLSDRFGLWLAFHPFRQSAYLEVAQHWVDVLADQYGIAIEWTPEVEREALSWALRRGVRSGRTANHFARSLVASRLRPEKAVSE